MNPSDKTYSESYGVISQWYDVMIDWPSRLSREGSSLTTWLERHGARSLLDIGCGTGHHAAWLARNGFSVLAVDRQEKMLEQARAVHAETLREFPERLEYRHADLISDEVEAGRFQAAMCLGNMWPHLLGPEQAQPLLEHIAQALIPGGGLLLQMKNVAGKRRRNAPFIPLVSRVHEGRKVFFLRYYDFSDTASPLVPIHFLSVLDSGEEPPVHRKNLHYCWEWEELKALLQDTGFEAPKLFNLIGGREIDPGEGDEWVVETKRAGA